MLATLPAYSSGFPANKTKEGSLIVKPKHCKTMHSAGYFTPKTWLVMRLTIFLLIAATLQVSAGTYSQMVTVRVKNVQIEKVFAAIEKQSGFSFIYAKSDLLKASAVTIEESNAPLKEVLDKCFANQPLTYSIKDKFIIVKGRSFAVTTLTSDAKDDITPFPSPTVRGKITNEAGDPVAGVTISIKDGKTIGVSDNEGMFYLTNIPDKSRLIFSAVTIETKEVTINSASANEITLNVAVKTKVSVLDEVQMMAYGTTSKRLNTGSAGKISAEEISRQPVSNLLATMAGRIPGLVITQSTGVTGGKFNVQIRGRNSIAQGSEPLFIIDGVPFAANNNNVNQLTSALSSYAGQGLSPLSSLNPSDIESIVVLKDADATAIYGSRGANGVMLITTKKGKAGATKININVNHGESRATKTSDMLTTQQYISMRNEAFNNDGVAPDIFSAPDLLIWDTTRNTDFKKFFTGNSASLTEIQASVSGGDVRTQFLIGGNYREESSVFPGKLGYKKGSLSLNLNHISTDKRFTVNLSASYNTDKNILPLNDYTSFKTLSPNLPSLTDSTGKLIWEMGGVPFENPLGYLQQSYVSKTDNLLSNMQIGYEVLPGLSLKVNLGYNTTLVDEKSRMPKSGQNPQSTFGGSAIFGNNSFKSWIIEPQAAYNVNLFKGKFSVLLGGTLQEIVNKRLTIQASGYTNDEMLGSVAGATNLTVTDGITQYKYGAIFGRLNYNYADKYIFNFSGRRDGSSRFGADKRFANFMAGGAAWIFSNEKFLKDKTGILSFGKIRASYGTTGNDQIGDYQYLDVWSNYPYRYQGSSLVPTRLLNPDYGWEVNRKLEFGVELGFINDRILFSASYYRNKSDNQLINYRLPSQTGFSSIIKNFPAIVENSGLEFSVNTKVVSSRGFKWSTSANITLPKNKLVSFPGLATSSYANSYVVGKSLNTFYGYHLLGVDATTGIYQFEDVNKDGSIGIEDYVPSVNLDPQFYGGINNLFEFKGWELSFFLEFKKQMGYNYNNYPIYNFTPGGMYNLPTIFLDHWRVPGNQSAIQQLTQTFTAAYDGQYYFSNSDGIFSDASFIRLKNVSLSYLLPAPALKKLSVQNVRLYLQGQNLFTITKFKGSDPETQNLFILPPLSTVTAGVQITF